ncbi:transglycosylase SLT domain-containing protein [Oleidesulfovibrio sp.]|uniref:transglycosylase SLT domain-containing protein n=1 Tax=Oleidesulfovibrio sp. TaxID=2909707 RepID=UPI003A89FACD
MAAFIRLAGQHLLNNARLPENLLFLIIAFWVLTSGGIILDRRTRFLRIAAFLCLLVIAATASWFWLRPEPAPEVPVLPEPVTENGKKLRRKLLEQGIFRPFTGDLKEIQQRKVLRVLVPYNRSDFFLDGAMQRGLAYDTGRAFQKWLNKKLGLKGEQRITFLYIPAAPDDMLRMLSEGQADIIGFEATLPAEAPPDMRFTTTWTQTAKAVVVSSKDAPALESVSQLAGKHIYALKSSALAGITADVSRQLVQQGLKEIKVTEAEGGLTQEDLMELVDGEAIAFAAVDYEKAQLWATVLSNLKIEENAVLTDTAARAWVVRKESIQLKSVCDSFIKYYRRSGDYAWLQQKYYDRTTYVADAGRSDELESLEATLPLFEKYGEMYDFAPLLLAAQGYQESRLNQSARSNRGAVGIMQLLPSTAAAKPVNMPDISTPDKNIHAGVKYLSHLRQTYFSGDAISYLDKMLFSFAAYNAGPGNMRKARRKTAEMGLNPDVWMDNLEVGIARTVGQQPIEYVRNIIKYYIVFQLVHEHQHIRRAALTSLGLPATFGR